MFYKKEELSSHLCNMEARGPNSEHNRYPVRYNHSWWTVFFIYGRKFGC